MLLKQSTAVTIPIGPFVDSTDGNTERTALTIAQADVRLSKNGGAYAQKNDATSSSHMEHGNYACALNSTDTNTLGILTIAVHVSGALYYKQDFMVVSSAAWDALTGTAAGVGFKTSLAKGTDITGFNDLSSATVKTQVTDALATDTYAESSAAPAATTTLKDMLVWLKTLARNKITQTATTQTLRNDADAANIATFTVSDDGTTFTRGKAT